MAIAILSNNLPGDLADVIAKQAHSLAFSEVASELKYVCKYFKKRLYDIEPLIANTTSSLDALFRQFPEMQVYEVDDGEKHVMYFMLDAENVYAAGHYYDAELSEDNPSFVVQFSIAEVGKHRVGYVNRIFIEGNVSHWTVVQAVRMSLPEELPPITTMRGACDLSRFANGNALYDFMHRHMMLPI